MPARIALALVLLLTPLAGCVMRSGPARFPLAPASLSPEAWPSRRTWDLPFLASASPTVLEDRGVFRVRIDGEWRTFEYRGPSYAVLLAEPGTRGVLRLVQPLDDEGEPLRPGEPPAIQFLTFPPDNTPPRALHELHTASVRHAMAFYRRSAILRQLPPAPGVEPRGVVVHIHSAGGVSYEMPLIRRLRESGWFVLLTNNPAIDWDFRHLTQRQRVDDDLSLVAAIAAEVDELLATRAYAVHDALDLLARHRPELRGLPVVGVGASAGALALPAVAALDPERFSALVLIGPGGNLFEISQRSSLRSQGLNWGLDGYRPPAHVASRFLELCRLDPLNAAEALTGLPVLQIDATMDRILPASGARALHERLGRPERWALPVGHSLLFWRLPALSGHIERWIDRHAPAPAGP